MRTTTSKLQIINNCQRGYSMMELVIYIALFALLSIVLVRSLITVMRTYASAAHYRALQNNGELVMERLTREVRNGTTVTTAACPSVSSSLQIDSVDEDDHAHTAAVSVSDGALQLAIDSGAVNPVSTNEVSVTAFTVCSFTTPVGSGIKSTLTLSTSGANPVSANFYSTVLLRGK